MKRVAALVLIVAGSLFGCTDVPMTAAEKDDCRVVRIIDGDTIDLRCHGQGTERARLMGYDTPETVYPGCREEKALGEAATRRLTSLVARAASTEAVRRGYDNYDRRLVRLSLDGRDVADTLVSEGLAVRYSGGPRINWCRQLTA